MKGRKYGAFSLICVFVVANLLGLFFVDETTSRRLGEVWDWFGSDLRSNMGVAEGIRLYIGPDGQPDGTDGRSDNQLDENGQFARNYPEVFAARSVVIVFGAPWCQWCKAEGKALVEPSKEYNIIYVNVDEERWGNLSDKWQLGSSVPVTVVVEDGKVIKTFEGYTEWETIKPFAEKAKKDGKSKNGFEIGPIDGGQFGDVDLGNQERNRRRR